MTLPAHRLKFWRKVCAWIAMFFLVITIAAFPLGIWVDLRWFPTALATMFGVGVFYGAAEKLSKVEDEAAAKENDNGTH